MGDCLRGGGAAYRGAMRHLALALVLLGCSADPVIAPRDCTPGTTTTCACPGASGVQTCTAAGTVGACVCPDGGGGADAVAVGDGGGADAPSTGDGGAPVDVVAVGDVVPSRDVPTVDTPVGDAGPVMLCGDASVNVAEGTYLTSGPMGGTFTNCGACGRACSSGQRCTAGACGPRCPNGERATCDGRMVNLGLGERDGGVVTHCGSCGNTCAVPMDRAAPHVAAFCDGCACVIDCEGDYRDCDGNPANGCEALFGDSNNCGACGRRCLQNQHCTPPPHMCAF